MLKDNYYHQIMVDEPAIGPTLDTERLQLRPLRLDDLWWNQRLIYSDPAVTWDGKTYEAVKALRALERRLKHWREHGFGMWAVIERGSGEPLGFAGLQYLEDTGDVEVGYYLGRNAWGKGYATEVGRAAVGYGLGVLGLSRVVAVMRPENLASQRVLAKLGLRHVRDEKHYGFMVQLWAFEAGDHPPTA